MGDSRFRKPYEDLKDALRPAEMLRSMSSEDVIAALAAASRETDLLLANVLATEALNRVAREAAAIELVGDGVYVVDTNTRLAYVNAAAIALLRRPSADLIGHPSREVVGLRDSGLSDASGRSPEEITLATGRALEREDGAVTLADRDLLVAYSVVPMLRDGIVTGAVVTFRDITARRRAETALAQSEARHRLLLDAIPDAILVVDLTGRVRYANPAARELFGAEDLIGLPIGIPSINPAEAMVDVSGAGGSWRSAKLRTLSSRWEGEAAFLSIYSRIRDEP